MSKDPAFLFYSADFLTGVMFMTDEEVGKYTKILCLLHQHGGKLSKEKLEKAVGTLSKSILEKLETDKKGLLYNKRLLLETEKRQAYCESRKKNLHMDKVHHSEDKGVFIPKKVKIHKAPKDRPFDPKVVELVHKTAEKLKERGK